MHALLLSSSARRGLAAAVNGQGADACSCVCSGLHTKQLFKAFLSDVIAAVVPKLLDAAIGPKTPKPQQFQDIDSKLNIHIIDSLFGCYV